MMAATDQGILFEGAYGRRGKASGQPMSLDTVFRIASMTKAVTSVAAMQLVERGLLELDAPVPPIDAALSSPRVLQGFDASGAPHTRPADKAITLRHLLTHTAGFTYEMWDANTVQYMKHTGTPSFMTGKLAGLRLPLAFDPGERWNYGINTDWVGLIVEAVSGQSLRDYFREHLFIPLGMCDTDFTPSPPQQSRLALVHRRRADGSLEMRAPESAFVREFYGGGGGLYSTVPDYLVFAQMLMHGGRFKGAQILSPQTVALMAENQIGDMSAGILTTVMPNLSNDVNLLPGVELKWGLACMINTEPGAAGRSAGTLSWAGIYNTYYWIDPVKKVTGVFMTQIQPFADAAALRLYDRFERHVYRLAAQRG